MLDIPSISAVVATVGVMIGVVFAVLELRNLVKTRETDLVFRLHSTLISQEYLEAWLRIATKESKGFDDFVKKYGCETIKVGNFFEGK